MHLHLSPITLLCIFLFYFPVLSIARAVDNNVVFSTSFPVPTSANIRTLVVARAVAETDAIGGPLTTTLQTSIASSSDGVSSSQSRSASVLSSRSGTHSHFRSTVTNVLATNSVSRVVVPGTQVTALSPPRTTAANANGAAATHHHDHTQLSQNNGGGPNVVAIVFAVLGGLAGLFVCVCLMRFLHNYRRTPRPDGVRNALDRHALDRELSEMCEAQQRAEAEAFRRSMLIANPPPPYQRAPEYDEAVLTPSPSTVPSSAAAPGASPNALSPDSPPTSPPETTTLLPVSTQTMPRASLR